MTRRVEASPGPLLDGYGLVRAVREHLDRAGTAAPYSDAFVGHPGPREDEVAARAATVASSNLDLITESRLDRVAQARADASSPSGNSIRWAASAAIGVLLLVGLVTTGGLRAVDRPSSAAAAPMLEALVAALVALPLGRWFLRDRLLLYLPAAAMRSTELVPVVVVASVGCATAAHLAWTMFRRRRRSAC